MVRLRSSPSYTPLTSLGIPTLSHANSSPFYSAVTFHQSEFHGMALPATQLLKPKFFTSCLYTWPGF